MSAWSSVAALSRTSRKTKMPPRGASKRAFAESVWRRGNPTNSFFCPMPLICARVVWKSCRSCATATTRNSTSVNRKDNDDGLRLLARYGGDHQTDQRIGLIGRVDQVLPEGIGVIPLFNNVRHGKI